MAASLSSMSKIYVGDMEQILEYLKANHTRDSTKRNYTCIWRQFNEFLIKLHPKPKYWEDRINLYFAYSTGVKSTNLQSYLSALKNILKTDGYPWDDNKMLLSTIVCACKIKNDVVKTRLPIHKNLLELLLFEIERIYRHSHPYLDILFRCIFRLTYYRLM